MSGSARTSVPPRVVTVAKVAGVGVVIVLALVAILTALGTDPPRTPGVMSDALGPDSGEPVEDYLARAAATLTPEGGAGDGGGAGNNHNDDDNDDDNNTDDGTPAPDASRWALVSAAAPLSVAEADRVVRDLPRVSGLFLQVPVEGVAMPVHGATLAEPVAGETGREGVFDRGVRRVIGELESGPAPTTGDRGAATTALTASRIRGGDPAIIGILVCGTTAQLRAAAEDPRVRAVEALPADAVWGRFATRPLLPQQVESASPLPDGDPVPAG